MGRKLGRTFGKWKHLAAKHKERAAKKRKAMSIWKSVKRASRKRFRLKRNRTRLRRVRVIRKARRFRKKKKKAKKRKMSKANALAKLILGRKRKPRAKPAK